MDSNSNLLSRTVHWHKTYIEGNQQQSNVYITNEEYSHSRFIQVVLFWFLVYKNWRIWKRLVFKKNRSTHNEMIWLEIDIIVTTAFKKELINYSYCHVLQNTHIYFLSMMNIRFSSYRDILHSFNQTLNFFSVVFCDNRQ